MKVSIASATPDDEMEEAMSKEIRQSVTIQAKPQQVYEALLDSRKHAAFTGSPARVVRKEGGRFTAYGTSLSGFNLQLTKDQEIVQAWRADDWPAGHYSVATFRLTPVRGATRLDFLQIGVPDRHFKGIRQGWIDYYWKPLKAWLEQASNPNHVHPDDLTIRRKE